MASPARAHFGDAILAEQRLPLKVLACLHATAWRALNREAAGSLSVAAQNRWGKCRNAKAAYFAIKVDDPPTFLQLAEWP